MQTRLFKRNLELQLGIRLKITILTIYNCQSLRHTLRKLHVYFTSFVIPFVSGLY